MNWSAVARQAGRLLAGLCALAMLDWSLRQTGCSTRLAADSEGLGMVITLIGAIYAVVFAFVIFVIWGQFNEVESATLRECSSLNELLRLGQYLNADSSRAIRRAVAEYAQRVVGSEWVSLGRHQRDPSAEKSFATLLQAVLRLTPAAAAEQPVLDRLIDIARKAGEQRDERIAKSLTRIPPTLLALVRIMAGALVLLVFFYPFHSDLASVGCLLVLATILFLSNLVMSDTDNPFQGIFNVSSRPFTELTV